MDAVSLYSEPAGKLVLLLQVKWDMIATVCNLEIPDLPRVTIA